MQTKESYGKTAAAVKNRSDLLQRRFKLKQNVPLYIMFTPIIIYLIVLKYVPLTGLVIAFKDYNLFDGIWGSEWVGLDHFQTLFSNPNTLTIIRNTFMLSILNLAVGFPIPIIVAILLNEVRKTWFLRSVQTLIYLPHFLNWVIIGGMVVMIFALENGMINRLIDYFGGEAYPFLYKHLSWLMVYLGSGVWKGAGWGAIIYLAALTNIDPHLYESASMDGASKFRQIWHITLPCLKPTIILLLILNMGNVMEVGFDQIWVLRNSVVSDISEVISVYSYNTGLRGGQFSMATAMGLFESLVGLVLVLSANRIARKYNQGLW